MFTAQWFSEYVSLIWVKRQENTTTPHPTGMALPDAECSARRKGKNWYPGKTQAWNQPAQKQFRETGTTITHINDFLKLTAAKLSLSTLSFQKDLSCYLAPACWGKGQGNIKNCPHLSQQCLKLTLKLAWIHCSRGEKHTMSEKAPRVWDQLHESFYKSQKEALERADKHLTLLIYLFTHNLFS